MPLLTLFTAPKPFTDPHINIIQRNAFQSWMSLGDDIEVVVIGDEPGIAQTCKEFGLRHLPDVRCNDMGTPLISSIFDLARNVNNSPLLMYTNADILFLPKLLDAVRWLAEHAEKYLVVGQRWDLDVEEPLEFSEGWGEELRARLQSSGKLHAKRGSDYFIYPRSCFQDIPDFAVGRAGWDNWMIFHARWQHWPVIDATPSITIVHQNHDYAHLPGGIRHYHQPESAVNVDKAGGRLSIFELPDANYFLKDKNIVRQPLTWKSFWREVEIFPLVHLHSRSLGRLSYALFHPIKTYGKVKNRIKLMFTQQENGED
ncbi:MAG: hypothetical protein SVT56_02040 [Chloroflexota bacterium]|jgi:hypothetical protein|nr:hypothetical protein [Chloroflexota bacterium]